MIIPFIHQRSLKINKKIKLISPSQFTWAAKARGRAGKFSESGVTDPTDRDSVLFFEECGDIIGNPGLALVKDLPIYY